MLGYLYIKLFYVSGTDTLKPVRITKQQRIRQVENETPVAFLATLTNHTYHLGAHQNIAFDNVITNLGDAYNSHMGGFIAPFSGVYVLSTTLLSYTGSDALFAVLHNGNVVTNIYHVINSDDRQSSSVTVVLQLSKGDDVSVANKDADKSVNGYHYSSFSGFLLQEIYDDTSVVGK